MTNTLRPVEEYAELLEERKSSLGVIPENTCPDIDTALAELSTLEKDFAFMQRNASRYETVDEFVKDLPDVGWLNTPKILEELRADNEQLRNLGRDWYQFSKELVEKIVNDRTHAYTLLKHWISTKSAPKSNDPYSNEYEEGYDRALYDMSLLLDTVFNKTETK